MGVLDASSDSVSVVGNLGDLLLWVKKADGGDSLSDPRGLPGVLH